MSIIASSLPVFVIRQSWTAAKHYSNKLPIHVKVAYNIISLHTVLRETFEGENFCEFVAVLWLFAKVFSMKFEGVASFGMAIHEGISLQKLYFSPIRGSFLPRKFPAMR